MLIGWKMGLLDLKAVEYGIVSLSTKFATTYDSYEWWLSCLYDPPTNKKDRILDGIK